MKNSYEIRDNVTAIFLKHRDQIIETIIETIDLPIAQAFPFTWYPAFCKGTNSYYVQGDISLKDGRRSKKRYSLHRWLMGNPVDGIVDHKNHNTLDNRRSKNLRILTHAKNNLNRKGPQVNNKSSRIQGVTWDKARGKWMAQVSINKKHKFLGRFNEISEAEKVVSDYRNRILGGA